MPCRRCTNSFPVSSADKKLDCTKTYLVFNLYLSVPLLTRRSRRCEVGWLVVNGGE